MLQVRFPREQTQTEICKPEIYWVSAFEINTCVGREGSRIRQKELEGYDAISTKATANSPGLVPCRAVLHWAEGARLL